MLSLLGHTKSSIYRLFKGLENLFCVDYVDDRRRVDFQVRIVHENFDFEFRIEDSD